MIMDFIITVAINMVIFYLGYYFGNKATRKEIEDETE